MEMIVYAPLNSLSVIGLVTYLHEAKFSRLSCDLFEEDICYHVKSVLLSSREADSQVDTNKMLHKLELHRVSLDRATHRASYNT